MEKYLTSPTTEAARNPGPCRGFDEHMGQRWIYPNNLAVRGYQKAAVELALFNNALIVLPTGFGKTFIAAVVMYNFYMWYPRGKVIFVAPTRPLVAQQIEECKKISGIPKVDCVEMTGMLSPERRNILWQQKRVIFATPQVVENDLNSNLMPAEDIRCIVIDEAHRAQGNFSYVNIVKTLHTNNPDGFRVLALSATPGSDIQRVQQVMQNLLINEILFRSETSIDLMQYRNEKSSKAWTVELLGKHKNFVERFKEITDPIFKQLYRAGLTYGSSTIDSVAKYTLIKAMNNINSNLVTPNIGAGSRGHLKFLCAAATALSSKFELLTLYGIRVFYSSISRALQENRSVIKTALCSKVDFEKMLDEMRAIFGDDIEPDADKLAKVDLLQGHPKLVVVRDLLVNHFKENQDKQETRAIVFTKFRESVVDIVQALKTYEPVIKAAGFVGQGTASKTSAGMTQKEQIELIKKFKAGVFNVIVATCVAEEGLDIGEVDLIICYDTSSSPISTTQRRGRTGRKRSGNVQTICTKGYEEKKLQKAGASRRQVEGQLYRRENYMHVRYRKAPRMVPLNIFPVCLEHKLYQVESDHEEEEIVEKKGRKKRQKRVKEKETDEKESLKKEKEKCEAKNEDESNDDDFQDIFNSSAVSDATNNQAKEDGDEEWDDDWTPPPLV